MKTNVMDSTKVTPTREEILSKMDKLITKYGTAKMNILELFNLRNRVQKLLQRNLSSVNQILMEVPTDVAEEWQPEVSSWEYQYYNDDTFWNFSHYNPTRFSSNQSFRYWNAPSTSTAFASNSISSRYVWTPESKNQSNSKADHQNNVPLAETTDGLLFVPEDHLPARVPSRKRLLDSNNDSPDDADDEDEDDDEEEEDAVKEPQLKRMKSVKVEENSESETLEANINIFNYDKICLICYQQECNCRLY